LEFNEKLQQLRKQHNLTQEQLAQQLYVSRTAVSKWESGKGYPSIDSLKAISRLFSVSIDELLASRELITLAEDENRQNMGRVLGLAFAILDLLVAAFIFLPLFTQKEGDFYLSVPLICFSEPSLPIIALSYTFLTLIAVTGMAELILEKRDSGKLWPRTHTLSLIVSSLAILFFIASRQLYVASFLFLLAVIKVALFIKSSKAK
jgi:transcriptional regulator with XRE-family HTH domain